MNIDISKINIDIEEVLRYMGIKAADRDSGDLEDLRGKICDTYSELTRVVRPKYLYREIRVKDFELKGNSIERFLCEAERAVLLVVTLGHEYEQFARSRMHMAGSIESLIVDAIGTEMVEKCTNQVEKEIRDSMCRSASSRFSPGYGDFGLEFQKVLLDFLEAHRIGIYCNEHYMMFPQKTVTAVVNFETAQRGCSLCGKSDCDYRV